LATAYPPGPSDALRGKEFPDSIIMSRPLRTFATRLVLEAAISFEEQSYRYYESALGQSVMSDTFDLLKKLLGEELRHRIRLEEAQRSGVLESHDNGEQSGSEHEMLPSDSFEELCEEWPPLLPADSKQQILARALQREKCAYHFYHRMARGASVKGLRRLFETLGEEEKRHIVWIRQEMERSET
jgi:rubrerythrin